jgi:hypothetical protein
VTRAAIVCAALAWTAPALAQPRLEWGGEAALALRVLWEGQSTADGFDAHPTPAVTGQLGSLRWGGVGAALGVDWSTFGVSGGEGTVSVSSRHHLLGVGPHVAWIDPIWRAGVLIEALVERVSVDVELDGAASRDGSGVHGGVRYGVESYARFGAVPLTFGVQIGGQRRDAKDDIFLGFSLGWIWGSMAPDLPDDEYDDEE